MNMDFYEFIKHFSEGRGELLLDGKWGLEREAQRVTSNGDLALTPHPAAFGNKLENPYITTDFSESQVELVTPPFGTVEKLYGYLQWLHQYAEKALQNELLWPLSMPPRLPDEKDIPISVFDGSAEGREKEVYRRGLALRYGKKMQMISGIHFNFSFGDRLLEHLYRLYGNGADRRSFVDGLYFSAARNFLRYRWLLIYLFGASPGMDPTFYPVIADELKIVSRCCPECCSPVGGIEKHAVSLRVSRFGYSDSVRGRNSVSYNSLQDYVSGIRRLLSKKSKEFTKLGVFRNGEQLQLNGNVLQKESEFYSPIRLKQRVAKGQSQLDALEQNGVKYGEVRIIDLDPFEKTGISLQQMRFLQLFMLFCLLEKSEPISVFELERINRNHHLAALSGRKSKLQLYGYEGGRISLREWSLTIFGKLMRLAELIDIAGPKENKGTYSACVSREYKKVIDPSLLPSARIRREMAIRGESFLDFGIRKAAEHRYGDGCGQSAVLHGITETRNTGTTEVRTTEVRTAVALKAPLSGTTEAVTCNNILEV
ncbi:MAG TPA: glutamate--cysteine ligase [Clostridia bacterium]|nr:glutamate--cysteine ligase [Clostridia bacterium]